MSRKYDRTDLEVFASDVQKTGREDRGVHQRRQEEAAQPEGHVEADRGSQCAGQPVCGWRCEAPGCVGSMTFNKNHISDYCWSKLPACERGGEKHSAEDFCVADA
jgi:hypothetical protein